MSYDFEESNKKLSQEIKEENKQEIVEENLRVNEPFTYLSNKVPFYLSLIVTFICFILAFKCFNPPNIYLKLGLALYLSFPTISIMVQIIFTKKIKFKLHNGELYINNILVHPDDIKKVAITEYTPYYLKNDWFKIPAVNFVGYKEYMVNIELVRKKTSDIFLFLCTKESAEKFITFLHLNQIPYGHVEMEPHRLFFYY